MRPHQPPSPPKYWEYDAGEGWRIFAGKTDEDNDRISLDFSHPEDWWFHVKSLPGSHVLLRAPEGENSSPDRKRLEMAAAVAAWHSKARNGGTTAVDGTLARNVTKPRGAKPGLVQITHVTVFKVKPSLPTATAPRS